MKTLFKIMLVPAAVLTAGLPARADNKAEAMAAIKGFGGDLKKTLQSAMKKDGPAGAIGACRIEAGPIAAKHGAGKWTVGRTSLKVRNPANAPDQWELKVLNMFEEKRAAGVSAGKLAHGEVVDRGGRKVYRFMKAIPTAGLCLNCHGTDLKPAVTAKLDELYPNDKARGFKAGDIRGAFTLEKPLK